MAISLKNDSPANKHDGVQTARANLLDMDRDDLQSFFRDMGEQDFRAGQVLQWVYQRGVTEFSDMTDLSKGLREQLAVVAQIKLPEIASEQISSDGTRKWLFKLADGNAIETVFIPEATRGTLCVSSQVGCSLNCTFCATARQGYNRNLSTSEIIGQVWLAEKLLRESRIVLDLMPTDDRLITNVVMMGMGEPLLNFDNVVSAMRLMLDDFSFGLSKRRVTLSTAGVVPAIDKLAETLPVSLAVSLHAPNDELRNKLVPLNKKFPVAQLLEACRRYVANKSRRKITFEYTMLKDVNDSESQAQQLADVLGDIPAKVNLIPFNPSNGIEFQRSSNNQINRFRDVLYARGLTAIIRKTRGEDIDAACGQLAGDFADRTKRSVRMMNKVS